LQVQNGYFFLNLVYQEDVRAVWAEEYIGSTEFISSGPRELCVAKNLPQ
jgi:hypothetical protein